MFLKSARREFVSCREVLSDNSADAIGSDAIARYKGTDGFINRGIMTPVYDVINKKPSNYFYLNRIIRRN